MVAARMKWSSLRNVIGFVASLLNRAAARNRATTFALVAAFAAAVAAPAAAQPIQIKHLGRTLNAHLALAEDRPLADGVAIIVHGTLGHGRMEIVAGLQEGLRRQGLNSLAITLSYGESNRKGPFDCAHAHRHSNEQAMVEIAAWIAWAKRSGAHHVDLVGHSRGGMQTARLLVERPDATVRRHVAIAPTAFEPGAPDAYLAVVGPQLPEDERARLKAILGWLDPALPPPELDPTRPMRLPQFLYCRDALVAPTTVRSYYAEPLQDTPTVLRQSQVPTLVVVAGADEIVRGLPARLKALPSVVKVDVVDGADHFFRDLFLDELLEKTVGFLLER